MPQSTEHFEPVPHKGWITLSVMLATVMTMLDTTIANVALPHMQGSLSATQDQITWVLTSYIVASAIMTLPTAWLAGRIGRKRIFMIAIAGFTISSVLCGIASSIGEMVFYRLLQGVFGACLVPISQAILLDINPKEKHASAMAMWGVGIMIGPILGPTLGGYLTEFYDWRWVFFINLPLGIICFFGVAAFLLETEQDDRRFDVFGFVTLALVIGMVQLMLDRGHHVDWFASVEFTVYFVLALVCIWMYAVHSYYAKSPFVSGVIFKDRNYATGFVFIFFVGVVLLATMALLPPYMQTLMGYPVVDVGLLMAPRGLGTMMSMLFVGKTAGKIDPRALILTGLVLIAYSLWEMTQFSTFVPGYLIVRSGVIQGLGIGLVMISISTLAFVTLDAKYRTEAAGLFSLIRNLGSSVGVSIVIALLSMNIQVNHSFLAENITPYNVGVIGQLGGGASNAGTAALVLLNTEINRQAATIGYINNFVFMMWMVIGCMPLVFLLENPDKPKKKRRWKDRYNRLVPEVLSLR